MDKTHFFNLINAGNIHSGLLSENFVRSHEDFVNFPINLKGLPILIAADPAVFEFSSDDVFGLSEKEILETLSALKGKTTMLFLTHRSQVLPFADQVVRLENGTINSV